MMVDYELTRSIPETWKEGEEFCADTSRSFVLEDDLHHLRGELEKSALSKCPLVEAKTDLCSPVLVAHQSLGHSVDWVKDEQLGDSRCA
jgi:hypothetical protein